MHLSFAADQPGRPIHSPRFLLRTHGPAPLVGDAACLRLHRVRIVTRRDRHERLCLRGDCVGVGLWRESVWRSGRLGSPDRARSHVGSREVERSSRQSGATRPSSGRRRRRSACPATGTGFATHPRNASAVQNRRGLSRVRRTRRVVHTDPTHDDTASDAHASTPLHRLPGAPPGARVSIQENNSSRPRSVHIIQRFGYHAWYAHRGVRSRRSDRRRRYGRGLPCH
jgi:hypothetical protein